MSDYQEKIKSLKGKYMKKSKKERFVRLLIKRWLPSYHLSKNPVKKIKESQPSTPLVQPQEGDSGPEPVRMEDWGSIWESADDNKTR